jgi:hypothetical protein
VVEARNNMEYFCNDTDRRELKFWEKIPSRCYFVPQRFHKNWPGIDTGPLRPGAGE